MITFKKWVEESNRTPEEIGADLEVTGQTVRNWMRGIGSPRVASAVRIEQMSKGKIPVSYWARVA